MIENWRSVPDSVNIEVSDMGRIRRKGQVFTPNRDSEGYLRVYIGHGKRERVNRLVLRVFAGDPPPGRNYCNHRNGKKDDNRLCNLEWSTPRENSMYAALRGAWKAHSPQRRIKGKRLSDGQLFLFKSQAQAARELNIHNSEINKMLKGKRKTCHGYIFEYAEEVPQTKPDPQIPGQMSIFEVML